MPPVKPMLAKSVAKIPPGMHYEAKWDGFRSIVFRDGAEVELGSRTGKPLTRYFPELAEALKERLPERCVLDGEIVIARGGRLDFDALTERIHPAASRGADAGREDPGLLRRLRPAGPGRPRPARRPADRPPRPAGPGPRRGDPAGARGALHDRHRGGPAVVRAVRGRRSGRGRGQAAHPALPPGRAGHVPDQARADGGRRRRRVPLPQERPGGGLAAAGSVRRAGPAPARGRVGGVRHEEARRTGRGLEPLRVDDVSGHPWAAWADEAAHETARLPGAPSRWSGKQDLSWVPLRPERGGRGGVRPHGERAAVPAHGPLRRWRPDRTPESCTYAQLEEPVRYDLAEILGEKHRG